MNKIKRDLEFLSECGYYGSSITGEFRRGSDINIIKLKDKEKNMKLLKGWIGKARPIYDIGIFELHPLKVKATIMSDYIALLGDELEIRYWYSFLV